MKTKIGSLYIRHSSLSRYNQKFVLVVSYTNIGRYDFEGVTVIYPGLDHKPRTYGELSLKQSSTVLV